MENIEINSFQNEEKEKQEYTGFVVDSMEKAEWAVKKIAMYEQKKAGDTRFCHSRDSKIYGLFG